MAAVTIIGIGDNGCVGMSAKAYSKIQKAQVLVGGSRHLEFFSDFKGETLCFQDGLMKTVNEIVEICSENNVVVLASGDPMFYGVGDLIARKVGIEHVEIIPTCSSVALAFSRIGKKWDDAKIISLHGRSIFGLVNKIQDENKVLLLTDSENTPANIAKYLLSYGEDDWQFYICENLEGADERVTSLKVNDVKGEYSDLNVVILIRDKKVRKRLISARKEEFFQKRMPKKGLITKREIRAIALMNLELREDSVVWDIGAGSGSISVEAAMIAKEGKVFAIETDEEGVEICKENIKAFKTDNVEVVNALAPSGLEELDSPNCVFIGGTKGNMEEIIKISYEKLIDGGVIVLSSVLMETTSKAISLFKELGLTYDVQLIQVSRSKKIASYLRYDSLNPIHLFTITKQVTDEEVR